MRNDSGADYPDARLRLVAGDVNQASGGGAQRLYRNQDVAMAEAAPAPPEQQAAGEYHLYAYPQRVTLRDGQVKQLALFRARDVPFDTEYRIEGGRGIYTNRYDEPQPEPVTARLLFDNDTASGLGEPLPGGVVRIYRAGGEAGLFLGEARIPDTPEDGDVRVTLGRVFDVRAERRQTDYVRINQPDNTFETAHEIALTNAKDEAVTVIVTENVPGDWTMLEESHPHAKVTAGRAEWRIEVPAGGEAVLSYRVRVRL